MTSTHAKSSTSALLYVCISQTRTEVFNAAQPQSQSQSQSQTQNAINVVLILYMEPSFVPSFLPPASRIPNKAGVHLFQSPTRPSPRLSQLLHLIMQTELGSRRPRTIHTPHTPLVVQAAMRVRAVLVGGATAGGARRGFHLPLGVLVHGARVGREGELAVRVWEVAGVVL